MAAIRFTKSTMEVKGLVQEAPLAEEQPQVHEAILGTGDNAAKEARRKSDPRPDMVCCFGSLHTIFY
jgi:hypothetical protein